MAVMLAMRDETNNSLKRIIEKRFNDTGVKDSKARIMAEAVAKLEAEMFGKE